MEIIVHRINKIKDLQHTNKNYGVEVDIRSYGHDLIVHQG